MKASSEITRIGFIGLGPMGTSMAGHLIAAGYRLTVHDSSLLAGLAIVPMLPAGIGFVVATLLGLLGGLWARD